MKEIKRKKKEVNVCTYRNVKKERTKESKQKKKKIESIHKPICENQIVIEVGEKN